MVHWLTTSMTQCLDMNISNIIKDKSLRISLAFLIIKRNQDLKFSTDTSKNVLVLVS